MRYQKHPAVEAASLQDEVILFHPEVNQFYVLNHTAAAIWSRLAQPATCEEIVAEIGVQFAGVTEADALCDVEEALRQMIDQRLVTQA